MKKPFHKHVIHRLKRSHLPFTKYLYERDTIFATIWVFLFIVVLGSIPLNFYFLNPLKLALKDFDFNDIAYASLGKAKNTTVDSNIVIINIGHADREGLAWIIEKTAEMKPKVMGLDVEFQGEREPEKDSLLRSVIQKHENLVLVTRLDWSDKNNLENRGFFGDVMRKKGHANLIGESKEERRTIRTYSAYEKVKKVRYNSFGTTLVAEYKPEAYEKLKERKKKVEFINYSRHTFKYHVIEAEDLLGGNVDSSAIEGRIALLGYINLDPNDIEDKIYSPLNPKIAGKSTPDMNGVVVHANFISMVLENNYLKKLPSWVNWLIAILVGWLHMSFFVRYYLEDHIWFHLVAKLAQVLSAIFFAYIGIFLFSRFNIKLDMKMTLIVIVLAVDVIYFYEAFAVWMHKKFGYKTVFHQHHH
jgi:CHASE2 domain-containing sensor protein